MNCNKTKIFIKRLIYRHTNSKNIWMKPYWYMLYDVSYSHYYKGCTNKSTTLIVHCVTLFWIYDDIFDEDI